MSRPQISQFALPYTNHIRYESAQGSAKLQEHESAASAATVFFFFLHKKGHVGVLETREATQYV